MNNNAFDPLDNVIQLEPHEIRNNETDLQPIVPAICEPVKPEKASYMWVYRDKMGQPVTARVRFDEQDGKKNVLPFTYGTLKGKTGWHYKAPKGISILYNLDKLANRPEAPVLLVEGEKTADAAAEIYPNYVVITSQGGSNAVQKTDWSALKGRHVILWGDNDEAGKHYIQTLIYTLGSVSYASLKVVLIDDPRIPEKWDLADPLPDTLKVRDKQAFFDEWIQKRREILTADVRFPNNIHQDDKKLYFSYENKDGKLMEMLISIPIFIKGRFADAQDMGHGMIIGFKSHSGKFKDVVMPMSLLADSKLLKRFLLDAGFIFHDIDALINILNQAQVKQNYQSIEQTGWQENSRHKKGFVLPTKERFNCKDFYVKEEMTHSLFGRSGFLSDWQREIGQHIGKNSRLCMAAYAGLAGILLEPMNKQGAGFHFVGSSSIGKTTANGLEQIASDLNHTVLVLDELSEINGHDAYNAAYMLSNGVGKQRAMPTGEARPVKKWLLNFISTRETTLKNKIAETGRKSNAGQESRMINIPADAGVGLGVLDCVPDGFMDARSFIDHLNQNAGLYYGEIGRAFIRFIVEQLNLDDNGYIYSLQDRINQLIDRWTPADADTQIKRIAEKFALAAVAGEEVTK